MAKYHEDLKEKIAALENQNEIKEAEIQLMLSERINTLRPSIAMSEMTIIILDMLAENNKFIQKNGLNERAKANKERLIKLLNYNLEFDKISDDNQTLKLVHKKLHTQNMQLRVINADLKKEIQIFHETSKEL